jgi:hypothetical protein
MPTRFQRLMAFGSFCLLALAAAADAQTASSGSSPTASRWEIEGYGGAGLPQSLSGGTAALPLPGPALTTSSPVFPTRQVPSWFFGDGATLLNDVNQAFGVSGRITPVDSILGEDAVSRGAAVAFGARLRRRMASRFALEVAFDVLPGSQDFADHVEPAAEATRASFEPAFSSLFTTGPFTGAFVQATKTLVATSTQDLAVTGALQYAWRPGATLMPYVTLGGGLLTSAGGEPSVTFAGNYRLNIVNQVPIQETDRATVRLDHHSTFAGVVGGGLRKTMSDRWGLSFDARAWIGGNTTDVLVDATPTITRGTPAGSIESLTRPSIQFANDPSTGRQSSLGGTLDGFKAFTGGVQTRVLLTVGVYRRF